MSNDTHLNRRHLMLGGAVAAAGLAAACSNSTAASAAATKDEGAVDLTGLSVLITGCSSGFGRLGAEHYARLGAKVFATMRNLPRPEADELEALAASESLDITVLEIDVRKDDQVKAGIDAALKASNGKLDVLINNAGLSIAGPIEAQDMEAMHHIFDTNLYGVQRMIRAALPSMRANGSGDLGNILQPNLLLRH